MSLPFEIIFEDDYLIAVHKPAGLVMHAPFGHFQASDETLEALVSAYCGRRVVLLHRLDRETSGVVLLGKHRGIVPALAQAFEAHRVRKTYWAVVVGQWPKDCQRIETRLVKRDARRWQVSDADGKIARTTLRVLGRSPTSSWLEVLPKTGRTHQIRVHCAWKGHPLEGDPLYGDTHVEHDEWGLALHAVRLELMHPVTKVPLSLEATLPEDGGRLRLTRFSLGSVPKDQKGTSSRRVKQDKRSVHERT